MTMRLSDSQRAFLRAESAPEGHFTKIRVALSLKGANLESLHQATGIAVQQLSRYVNGGDLMLSTACRIAQVFGLAVCDLWPNAPIAKANRRPDAKPARAGKRVNPKPKSQKAPKGIAA